MTCFAVTAPARGALLRREIDDVLVGLIGRRWHIARVRGRLTDRGRNLIDPLITRRIGQRAVGRRNTAGVIVAIAAIAISIVRVAVINAAAAIVAAPVIAAAVTAGTAISAMISPVQGVFVGEGRSVGMVADASAIADAGTPPRWSPATGLPMTWPPPQPPPRPPASASPAASVATTATPAKQAALSFELRRMSLPFRVVSGRLPARTAEVARFRDARAAPRQHRTINVP